LQYEPRVIVTDKLKSYGVAQREILPRIEHRQSRYLTDVFDKTFLVWCLCYFLLARVIAWPRAGIRMQARRAA
jgi:hypothetical protein